MKARGLEQGERRLSKVRWPSFMLHCHPLDERRTKRRWTFDAHKDNRLKDNLIPGLQPINVSVIHQSAHCFVNQLVNSLELLKCF